MSKQNTAILIVPGAWHTPDAYSDISSRLRKLNYAVEGIHLPSVGDDAAGVDGKKEAQVIRDRILYYLDEQIQDVVIVCHSYGGAPAGCAGRGLSKPERIEQEKSTGIIGLIYMSAFILPEGMSSLQQIGGQYGPFAPKDTPSEGLAMVASPMETIYHDCDLDVARDICQDLKPHSMAAFETLSSAALWEQPEMKGRLAYLKCTNDKSPPPVDGKLNPESGPSWLVKEITTGHAPYAAKPEETVEIFDDWIRHFVHL